MKTKNKHLFCKKSITKYFSGILFFAFFALALPSYALAAATLFLNPSSGSHNVGVTFSVSVRVDTGGDAINAGQADINFDASKLNVVSIDTGSSIFNMWAEFPSFSNSSGTVHFSGGVASPGFTGTGTIFNINFNPIAQGTAAVSYGSGGQVLKNDGLGTNILGSTSGGTYTFIPPPPTPLSVTCSASPSSAGLNQNITFTATPAGGTGTRSYNWTNACTGTAQTCSNSFTTYGDKTATVTVTSGAETASANCAAAINPPGLNVGCSSSPNPASMGEQVTFSATASGGTGTYSYSWTNACIGTTQSCLSSFPTSGNKTASVSVTSGTQTSSGSCTVYVNPPPGLSVSCSASSPSANTDEQVTFSATASGGPGSYSYSWSGACTGASSTCSNSFSSGGPQTATVTVTSDSQSTSDTCTVYINVVCPVAPPPAIVQDTQEAIQAITEQVGAATEEIAKAIKNPTGSAVTKAISTTGAVATAVAVAVASSVSLPSLLLLPFRLFALLMVGFGIRKKSSYWGVVYDSVTKQPIDPAYVTLQTLEGKDITSVITDIEGRYGFLVEPDIYKIVVRRTNYSFPSRNLFSRANDEVYSDLYFGEGVEIKTLGQSINKNIPIDPVKFDWNEFAKKDKGMVRFYSKLDLLARRISSVFFVAGFVVAAGALYFDYNIYNSAIMGLYLLLTVLMMLGFRPKSYGSLIDQKTGAPLSFAIVRVVESTLNKEISRKVADKFGRYYALVPKGQYYLKIEKKNDDGTYSLIYTSPAIDVAKKGIINKTFRIQ